jgi:hypothetical protein
MFSRPLITETRKFIRVPSERVYRDLSYFLQEDLGASNVVNQEDSLLIIAKKGILSVIRIKIEIHIQPEGEASKVELNFGYRNFLAAALALLSFLVLVSVVSLSFIPLLVIIPLIMLMQILGSGAVTSFATSISEFLLLLEKSHAKEQLNEARRRWQADARGISDLYERLAAAHTEIWGHTRVLEYKISEYMEEGLTREEAIRRVADDEGTLHSR